MKKKMIIFICCICALGLIVYSILSRLGNYQLNGDQDLMVAIADVEHITDASQVKIIKINEVKGSKHQYKICLYEYENKLYSINFVEMPFQTYDIFGEVVGEIKKDQFLTYNVSYEGINIIIIYGNNNNRNISSYKYVLSDQILKKDINEEYITDYYETNTSIMGDGYLYDKDNQEIGVF